MAKKALLNADTDTRRLTIYAEEDGEKYIQTKQDCEGIVKAAKAMADMTHSKDMKPVALIPLEVLNRAFLEGWFEDTARWRQWANDPENRDFRITQGRL